MAQAFLGPCFNACDSGLYQIDMKRQTSDAQASVFAVFDSNLYFIIRSARYFYLQYL